MIFKFNLAGSHLTAGFHSIIIMDIDKSDTPKVENQSHDNKLCVVIPYVKSVHHQMALLYAIRSLCTYLMAEFRIIVIGDKEDWFGPELVHVPASLSIVDNDSIMDDAFVKVTLVEKLSSEIIWMMPDTFLLHPLSVHHMMIPKVSESFKFDTGLPFGVNVEKVVQYLTDEKVEPLTMEACQKCSSSACPVIVDWRKNEWLLPVVSARPDAKKFEELTSKRFFLRFSKEGWSEFLEGRLAVMYPNKSKYEL